MKTLNLSELASLLRMATKYIFPSLRSDIITHLKLLYPSKLDDFVSKHRLASLPKDFNGIVGIHLGQQCDVPAILPAAYYLCSRINHAQLFDGVQKYEPGSMNKLSATEYRSVMVFHAYLAQQVTKIVVEDLGNRYPCNSPKCRDVYTSLFSAYDVQITSKIFSFHPTNHGRQLCTTCACQLDERRIRLKHKIWLRLPSACGLGGWESL